MKNIKIVCDRCGIVIEGDVTGMELKLPNSYEKFYAEKGLKSEQKGNFVEKVDLCSNCVSDLIDFVHNHN